MDRYVTHASFTLERSYPVPPARVFAAWADPGLKSRWFAGGTGEGHQLDFRVGGREVASGGPEGGPVMTFESLYREIVPQERIVYTSTMSAGADVITVSLTTVEFKAARGGTQQAAPGGTQQATPGGTQLVLTEQGAFLDGREEPAWRENGTADQLKALAALLESTALPESTALESDG